VITYKSQSSKFRGFENSFLSNISKIFTSSDYLTDSKQLGKIKKWSFKRYYYCERKRVRNNYHNPEWPKVEVKYHEEKVTRPNILEFI